MRKISSTLKKLVAQLNDGEFHSGTSLGQALGISRNAVWKQLNQLTQHGISIESIKNRGHRLVEPLTLLDKRKINLQLDDQIQSRIASLDIFASLKSTNDYIKSLPPASLNEIRLCLAEHQEAGKGRLGRSWFSPFGTNIYLTCGWHTTHDVSNLGGLALAAMMATANALTEKTSIEDFKIKWPSDLLWNGNKVGGCLVEIVGESHHSSWVVIGIGINVNMPVSRSAHRSWSSLKDIAQGYLDRNILIANIITHLVKALDQFNEKQFTSFIKEWKSFDYLFDKLIQLKQGEKQWRGKMIGVNQTGHLILQDKNNLITTYSSGDVNII